MFCVFSYSTIKVIFPKVWGWGCFKPADEHHALLSQLNTSDLPIKKILFHYKILS